MCISVDLPEPDGPMTAVSSPARDLERDAAERVDGRVPLPVAAVQPLCRDDGAVRFRIAHRLLPGRVTVCPGP